MKKEDKLELVTSCMAGTEDLISSEIASFGGSVLNSSTGVVTWQGTLEAAYMCCLWSRYGSRLLLNISSFSAESEGQLYAGVMHIDWSEHMTVETTFAVDCTLAKGTTIRHSKFAALRIKDGVADFFRKKEQRRPSVQKTQPGVRIHVFVAENNIATVSIDLSGESLHKRGYRESGVIAPLKENLAAAIVALSGWPENNSGLPLVDPMCGSGTLLIEAALIFGDSAPGLSRKYYGFFGWNKHDKRLWQDLVSKAVGCENRGLEKDWPVMLGYDADPQAVAAARKNIEKAGLTGKIQIKQASVSAIKPPEKKGVILCNPPYGERLAEQQVVEQLYAAMGRLFRQRFAEWRLAIFVASQDAAAKFEIGWNKKYRLYNGSIPCRLLIGQQNSSLSPEKAHSWALAEEDFEGEGQALANRLKKNWKKLQKWLQKERVECFRIYDRDLPEFNISVDFYGKWVHVQEYAPPSSIPQDVAKKRFNTALFVIRKLFQVNRERVFIKTRSRQKGKDQYQRKGELRRMKTVREGDCYFLVNFTDYLDTGLFLDHRPTRKQIGELSNGLHFLNLFGYTGSATVHSAQAGAQTTTTVDLSQNYLNWAQMNMSLNGFTGPAHEYIKADVMQWLQEETRRYDLIFVDPPTFSNTKKTKRIFDIQRDHGQLIQHTMKRLSPGGLLIFSTNYKRFSLQTNLLKLYTIEEISSKSVPADFQRKQKVHKCWEIRHRK